MDVDGFKLLLEFLNQSQFVNKRNQVRAKSAKVSRTQLKPVAETSRPLLKTTKTTVWKRISVALVAPQVLFENAQRYKIVDK
jgi:hypothetical protein